MTPRKQQFKNRIKDLETTDFEHPVNFFSQPPTSALPTTQPVASQDESWIATPEGYEGQLAVDVYHDQQNVYIRAIIGGINPNDLEVHLNNDMVTIKGKRNAPSEQIPSDHFFIQECYWGGFSRSIILPVDIKNDAVEAKVEHGVLTVTLPKSHRPKNSRIPVKAVS